MSKAPQDPEASTTRKARNIKLLTPEEASEMLKVNPRQLKELARQKKIPALKIGKLWRFPEEALERWISSQGGLSFNQEPDVDSVVAEIVRR